MKKFIPVLMLLLAAFMFFGCDDGGGDKTPPVIPATYSLEAGTSYTFPSTADFTLSPETDEDSYIVAIDEDNGKMIIGYTNGTATIIAKDSAGKELAKCKVTVYPVSVSLNLKVAEWGDVPKSEANVGTTSGSWPADLAEASNAPNGDLILKYNGKNRQRGVIPLTPAQIEKLTTEYSERISGFTFRIDATVTLGTVPSGMNWFTPEKHAGFRYHLGNQTISASGSVYYNANQTGKQSPLYGNKKEDGSPNTQDDHLVEFLGNDHSWDQATREQNFKSFMIQAMFRNQAGSNDNNQDVTFPEVILTIKSIKIEIGDTRTEAEVDAALGQ